MQSSKFDNWFHVNDSDYRLVTSAFLSPQAVFWIRLVLAVYAAGASVVDTVVNIVIYGKAVGNYYAFFTRMSWIGLAAYLGASALHSWSFTRALARVQRAGGSFVEPPKYFLQRWPTWLRFLHMILLTTVMAFPPMVTAVYWALLTSSSTFSDAHHTWANMTFHTFNAVVSLLELILLSRVKLYWIYAPVLVIIQAGYLGVAFITFETQGVWTYGFLDPVKSGSKRPIYIVAVAAAGLVSFLFMWAISLARDKLQPRAKGVPVFATVSSLREKEGSVVSA